MSALIRIALLLDQAVQTMTEGERGGTKRQPIFDFDDPRIVEPADLERLLADAPSAIAGQEIRNERARRRARDKTRKRGIVKL